MNELNLFIQIFFNLIYQNQKCSECKENEFGEYFYKNNFMVQNDSLNEMIKI